MKSLLILGAGGHGRVVADAASLLGFIKIAFLDDADIRPAIPNPFEIIGKISHLENFSLHWKTAIVAIGNNEARLHYFQRLKEFGFDAPAVVHPTAVVSRHAQIGGGVFIAAGAIVNIGARIGNAAILNTGSTIDHDCVVGDGAHISPGANLAGSVSVGERAWVGIGASIREGMRVGTDSIVGAGSAVVSNVPDSATVVGTPAKVLKKGHTFC